ncbi:DUF427 domain-containing protein [Caenispirillum salinarum]|uniref:DUF427 domain-containing protein n=1 Tax=Caenispirillum salinarum TaxID=859058 RepID=UPI00384F4E1A
MTDRPRESVWDYPRPPRLEPASSRLRVVFAGETIADTRRGFRLLETSHPPVYYIPPDDVRLDLLTAAPGPRSFCEFKGRATYWTIRVGSATAERAAWSYPEPAAPYYPIADCLAFYPDMVDACFVGDEQAMPQEGSFYGGWITSEIEGPFKGGPGTWGW